MKEIWDKLLAEKGQNGGRHAEPTGCRHLAGVRLALPASHRMSPEHQWECAIEDCLMQLTNTDVRIARAAAVQFPSGPTLRMRDP